MLELINKGSFTIDEKLLPERLMAKKLGVSRPSVREAYSALEIAGILESKAGSGTYIKSTNINKFYINKIEDISKKEESPYEILEVRKIIESEAVYLAAKNASKEDVESINNILQSMKSEMESNDNYSLETDALFHISIAKASGNSIILNIMKYISDLTKERIWRNIREKLVNHKDHRKRDIKYHEEIIALIRKKDAIAARSKTRKHFAEIQKEMLDDLD